MENKSLDEDAETSALRGCTDDDVFSEVEVGGSDDDDQFERVCAICDNGGNLLCCEGECMRSFHATEEENCESLGFTEEQVQAISTFYCKNCQYKRHQCFACGKLGSSDKTSTAARVFCCVSGECGRFYHPSCVSKFLHRDNEAGSELLKKKIASGAPFTCPLHKCCVCNLGEIEEDDELRFASCRRCPKSYHRKCLPKEIAFEDSEDDIIQRAWEDLMPKKRILIYCLEHEIDDDIGTPIRNHVRFPAQTLDSLSRRAPDSPNDSSRVVKGRDKTSSAARPNSVKERSLRDTSCTLIETPSKVKATLNERKKFHTVKPVVEETSNILPLDAESKKRILALMKDASSSITLEMVNKKYKPPSTHAYSSKDIIDKTITLGKVEGSVEALRTALRKLEEGCSIEDAKAVCGPGLLSQMMKWKNKLKIYLAPALHGIRYTSYGRHFTNSDKLNKIVDMLHWYARDGDMIVDFGCGANEFSCLMKKKLDEVGKKCSYKNYDIIYPKNDFNFEQRNWLTVHPKELPPGSKLIMGLNPPFGVNSNLANQFINKALEFKPKLVVLIVPPETERLDAKNPRYDLIFQDNDLLTGKSFYLPGSVDVNNKQIEQWNRIPPLLYFWSRQDWTTNHKTIAQQQGHLREVSHMVSSDNEFHIADFPLKDNEHTGETSTLLDNHLKAKETKRLQQKDAASKTEKYKEELLCDNRWSARHKNLENEIWLNKLSGEVNQRESGKKLVDDKTKTQPHFWTEEAENREEKEASMAENHHREELPCANSSSGLEIPDSWILKKSRISPGKRRRDLSEIYLENKKKSRLGAHFQTEEAKQLQEKAASFAESQTLNLACANCSSEGHKNLENGILKKIHNRNGNWRRELGEISPEDKKEISPEDKKKSGRSLYESQPAEMSLDKDVGNESYRRIDGKFSGPHQSGEAYGGTEEDDMARKCHTSYQDPVQKSKNLQETVSGFQIEIVDNNRYRSHIDDSPSQKGSYAASHDPRSSPCESVADSSHNRMCSSTSTSMMQRDAPHPAEVNHTRMNNSTSEQPSVSKNKLDILGFAPGPNRFAHNSSAGWLDE